MQRFQTAICKDVLLAARRSVSSRAALKYTDLRELKDEQIAVARERVFGPQGNMPGDRQWQKKLEGRKLMRWYFPSKYNLQDFRTDDYFEMQAERFAPREEHESIPQLVKMLQKIVDHREELRAFFKTMDEPTFLGSPTLQDLYGMFRLLDSDHALPFQPPESVFLDHSPFGGIKPLLRLVSKGPSDEYQWDEVELEQAAKFIELQKVLPKDKFDALKARVSRLASKEEVCAMIEAQEKDHFITPLNTCTYIFETSHDTRSPAPGKESSDEHADRPKTVEMDSAGESQTPEETVHGETQITSDDATQQPAETVNDEMHMKSDDATSQAPKSDGTHDVGQQASGEESSDAHADRPKTAEMDSAGESQTPEETVHGETQITSDDATQQPAETVNDEMHMKSDDATSQAPKSDGTHDVGQQASGDVFGREKLKKMAHYPVEQSLGGSREKRAKEMKKAATELEKLKTKGKPDIRNYLSRRHRFIDPMYRRRRLKWLERQMSDLNREKDVKFSSYYAPHPDDTPEWPTNKGSTTVVWPSPYH